MTWRSDVERRLLSLENRTGWLEDRAAVLERATGENRLSIARLEVRCGDAPPEPDLNRWVDEFKELEQAHLGTWRALCDDYSHNARHVIEAYTNLASATDDLYYQDRALELAERLERAYDRVPRNRNDDLIKNMALPRLYRATGVTAIRDHCRRVLDDVRDVRVGSPYGDIDYRLFSHKQNSYPFDYAGPWGRWQGQSTATWLLASVADTEWAEDMRVAWKRELDPNPGIWGATWNMSEERYPYARNTFKAGRECRLIDVDVEHDVFVKAWELVRVRPAPGPDVPVVHQYIDGTTSTDPQRGATALYDGWYRVGVWSKDMRDVIDWTLEQTSGPWWNLNDSDPARVRRAALLAGRAWVEGVR